MSVRTILTSIHGRELGLNTDRALVCPGGYVIEGIPDGILRFNDDGIAEESIHGLLQLVDTTNQVPVNTSERKVTFDTVINQENVTFINGSQIITDSAGVYVLLIGAQVGKASGSALRILDMWIKINGVNAPYSTVRQGLTNLDTTVLVFNFVGRLEREDMLEIYIAVDNTTGGMGLYTTTPAVAPVIPSIILSLGKLR